MKTRDDYQDLILRIGQVPAIVRVSKRRKQPEQANCPDCQTDPKCLSDQAAVAAVSNRDREAA